MTNDGHLKNGPPGWQQLLTELDTTLTQRWPNYTIEQVKEKFGTLRFYADPGVEPPDFADDDAGTAAHNEWYAGNVDTFHAVIAEYEHRSASICALCGQPGKTGTADYWLATRCAQCAPDGWVANDARCAHLSIVAGTCDTCGRQCLARLEHTDVVMSNTHLAGTCLGEWCTIHNRSDHPMRAFEQRWRADRGLMERICPHGVGHPDPDDYKVAGADASSESVHGCDGCCTGAGR